MVSLRAKNHPNFCYIDMLQKLKKNRGELEFVIGAAKTDFGEINSGKFWCFR